MVDKVPELTVGVVNFNGASTILRTLGSIYSQVGVRVTVIMMDDGSTDGSPELVEREFPLVHIHREPRNTRQVSRLRNQAIELAHTERIFLSDNDIVYDRHCLAELMGQMDRSLDIATCSPRLMYLDEPDRVYVGACQVHFLALSIGRERGRPFSTSNEQPLLHAGGGNLLLSRPCVREVGAFDEDYLMGWGEDGELYQRLMLAGYRCLYVPTAYGLHEDKPFSSLRHYRASGQIYNRWQYVLTHYAALTLLILLPAFLLFEVVQIVLFLRKGMLVLYLKSQWQALRHLPAFLHKRRRIQLMRRVSDRELLHSGPIFVSPSVLQGSHSLRLGLGLSNAFFDFYWKLVRRLIPRAGSV